MIMNESSRDAAAPARTKRFRLLEELGAQSRWETAALVLFLFFVAIAPLPYGAITTEGELALELFAFMTLALLFALAGGCMGRLLFDRRHRQEPMP